MTDSTPTTTSDIRGKLASAVKPARGRLGDSLFAAITLLAVATIIILMALLIYELVQQALPAIRAFGAGFLISTNWDPVNNIYGALPFIFGTVVSSLLALLMAVPLSLGIAIYLSQFAPKWLRSPLGFVVELLAAIPSVVYGLWGIFVLAPFLGRTVEPFLSGHLGSIPFFAGPVYGVGLFAASVVLAIMIIPTISAISRESMLNVSRDQKEAAQALGATPWETVKMAVLPLSRPGIIGAVILGLGRALGETMAVTMLIGNSPKISASIFAPAYSIASVIASEFQEVTAGVHMAALIEMALILLVITLMLNLLARLLIQKTGGRALKSRGRS
ncbi:MAG: phosphate ABC transporter permease subunit PstC [Thermoleophilia bacterium]